jgi:hypothetical protein
MDGYNPGRPAERKTAIADRGLEGEYDRIEMARQMDRSSIGGGS